MAEELLISESENRIKRYSQLLPQLKSLASGETNLVANLANICAAIRQTFGFFWVGFYLVDGDELVLGPFQGDIACTRITKGKGVCGTAWLKESTLIVDDVDAFPGHIVCSSNSRSEAVVPIIKNGVVIGVLDIDSNLLNDFTSVDAIELEKLCGWISELF